MSLLDRVRDLVTHPPEGDAWDDAGVEDAVAVATTLAAAWDPEPDDHRPSASRAATLGAFAAAMSRQLELRQGAAGPALPRVGAAPEIRRGGRRSAFILVAAGTLLVMSVGAVAASAPGGPMYDVRVATEGLLLPQAADDRAVTQVERLDERVAEARVAAERGDLVGVSAALHAYARIANEAAAGPAADPATLTRLAARVRAQQEAISRIGAADRGLDAGRERARVAGQALLAAFEVPGPGPGAGPSPSPEEVSPRGSSPEEAPAATGRPVPPASPRASTAPGSQGGSPPPGATADPRGSSRPTSTASPRPTTSPERTPTPTPRASVDPPSGGGGSGPGPTDGGAGSGPGATDAGGGSGPGPSGRS